MFDNDRQHRWLIESYLGYGTPTKLVLPGRVLRDRGVIQSTKLDSKWRNLLNTFRRFATGEVAGACVRAKFREFEVTGITDDEGYFWLELDLPAPYATGSWLDVKLELYGSRSSDAAAAVGRSEVLVPPPSARFGVISDIDDTVVTTNVTSTLKMLTTVLFSNAHARMPFAGIAAFYRALQQGATGAEGNPVFYVSNGPWNFYGLLTEFFRLNGIPLGPIFLRDFGPRVLFSRHTTTGGHKLAYIERILATYERLPFVLIGDSGERDPEIYTEVVKRYPKRIRAIYIRSVDPRAERLSALAALAEQVTTTPTQFVVAPDSASAAAHAAGEGLIASSAVTLVARESNV